MADEIDERTRFYDALGRALSAWQGVETEAYILFEVILRGAPKHLPSIIFHHLQSFDNRVQLLDKCAYFAVPAKLRDNWATIRKRLTAQTKVRNRMVHFAMGRTVNERERIREFNLRPSFFDASYAIKDRWKNPEFTMNQRRLLRAADDFRVLRDDLHAFTNDLRAIAK